MWKSNKQTTNTPRHSEEHPAVAPHLGVGERRAAAGDSAAVAHDHSGGKVLVEQGGHRVLVGLIVHLFESFSWRTSSLIVVEAGRPTEHEHAQQAKQAHTAA